MRPISIGLAIALALGALAPAAVMSQPKKPPAVTEKDRKQGMAEAPPLLQSIGLSCQVSDARFIGKTEDKKAKTSTNYYEVACDKNMGFILSAPSGGTATVFSCIEANTPQADGKPPSLPCMLPANSDPKAMLAPLMQKAKTPCVIENTRGIGQTKANTFIEVACQGGSGYIVQASAPLDVTKDAVAQSCLIYDESDGNIKCTLTDKATRLAVVDSLAKQANNGCTVKDRRYVGAATNGGTYFEASCADGKGYMYKVEGDKLAQTLECAKASGIMGGCTLTDARQAETEQAGLYTKLAKGVGFNCEVSKYAVFPAAGSKDIVELVCSNRPDGGVAIFEAGGKGRVYDCGHALVAGYRCGLNKQETGNEALTADLRKFDQKSCTVSNSRLMAKTAKNTILLEVACSDGLKGYVIEYNPDPVSAVGATGCAFAGNCKLPGNT